MLCTLINRTLAQGNIAVSCSICVRKQLGGTYLVTISASGTGPTRGPDQTKRLDRQYPTWPLTDPGPSEQYVCRFFTAPRLHWYSVQIIQSSRSQKQLTSKHRPSMLVLLVDRLLAPREFHNSSLKICPANDYIRVIDFVEQDSNFSSCGSVTKKSIFETAISLSPFGEFTPLHSLCTMLGYTLAS